jgi:hypothetical protein
MPISVNVNISQYAVLITDLVTGDKIVQKRMGKSGMLAAAASVVRAWVAGLVCRLQPALPTSMC